MGTALSAGLTLKKVPFLALSYLDEKKCHYPSFLGQFLSCIICIFIHLFCIFFSLGAISSAQFGSAWLICMNAKHGEAVCEAQCSKVWAAWLGSAQSLEWVQHDI